MEKITIKAYALNDNKNEIVRLDEKAQRIINQLQRASGLSARYLVSEIIHQAADYVVFEEINNGDVQMS